MMYGWSMGPDAWLMMGIWILALGALVWILVREPRRPERDDAMHTLRSRLARGEISAEEFEQARRLLDPNGPLGSPR